MKNPNFQRLNKLAQALYDKKGMNILAIDLQAVSTMTDFFLIAMGSVDRHVKALAKAILDAEAEEGRKPYQVEGEANGDWIVLDFGDIVVHLFNPDMRERFSLEEVWNEGKIVDLKIDIHKDQDA